MGRLILKEREIEKEDLYLGKILIICEGHTEKNYIKHIVSRINTLIKYNEIEVVDAASIREESNPHIVLAGGDANRVFYKANEIVENNPQYLNYEKYLVFDCDAPKDTIQQTIKLMLESPNEYKLALSNFMFETWLLMHFEKVEKKYDKSVLYQKLANYLKLSPGEKYSNLKADDEMINSIFQIGNVEKAIKNGKGLHNEYREKNLDISEDIAAMNPHVLIYELIELLLKYVA